MIKELTLRQARLLSEKTQQEIADEIGVTPQMVNNWEKHGAMPSAKRFMAFCKACDVPPDMIKL